ncbi:MAG: amino acid ABC transporter substrate-binding protein [Fusobacteriaceae bacterium]
MKKIILILIGILLLGTQILAKDNSLERIKKQGKIIVGLDDTFAPMGFRDPDGNIIGFDIDLANEVAKRIGVKAEFLPCDWDGILLSLNSKKIDLIWNGLTVTEKRKENIIFSEPYLTGNQIIITTPNSGIKNSSDLSGKIVGTQTGSSSYFSLEKTASFKNIKEVKNYPEYVSALLDLKNGRLDAVVIDSATGEYYLTLQNRKSNKTIYVAIPENLNTEQETMAVGIRKTDIELKKTIDATLNEMRADGTFDSIYKKWFGGK